MKNQSESILKIFSCSMSCRRNNCYWVEWKSSMNEWFTDFPSFIPKGWLHPVLSDWNRSFLTSRDACLPKKLVFEQFCHCASPRHFLLYSDTEQERESSIKECWLTIILHLSVRGIAERGHAPFHRQCIEKAGFWGKGSWCHVANLSLLWDTPNLSFRLQNGKKKNQTGPHWYIQVFGF